MPKMKVSTVPSVKGQAPTQSMEGWVRHVFGSRSEVAPPAEPIVQSPSKQPKGRGKSY